MTNGLTSPRAAERPPGPTPQAARGAPPPSDAFAGMLDAHQARTAIAEGHSPEKPTADPAPQAKDEAPADAATPVVKDSDQAETPATDDAATLAATVLAALVPVATAPVEAPAAPAPVAATSTTPEVPVVAAPAVQVETAPVVATAPVVVPAAPTPGPAVAAAAETAPVVAEQVTAVPTTGGAPVASAAVDPALTAVKPNAGGQTATGQQDQPASQPKPDPQPVPAAAQQARVAAAYAPPAEHSAQAAAAPTVNVTAPTTAAAPAATPQSAVPAATPVPLSRSAEAVEHVLRLAESRGVTHARIALHPEDLGSVDVHIRSTNEGIVARVVAHSAEAVQTLQHAANDLRRSLEEQGINVLNLDISQSGDERSAGRAGAGDTGSNANANGEAATGTADDETSTATSTLRLPSGVLVDVLA